MCSIFKFGHCVGRNFDYEVTYDEELRKIKKDEFNNSYEITGMCTGFVKDYPLMYDGINEKGLVCGALAFEGNAFYNDEKEGCLNVPVYDVVKYILGSCASVDDVTAILDDLNITDKQFNANFPNSDLHWFVADRQKSIIVEQTEDGLNYYEGDVMTNNPPYSLQISNYESSGEKIGETDFKNELPYKTRGLETSNLSGDYTSMGRFERLSYLKEKLENSDNDFNPVAQSFHLLSSVEQIYGATPVNDDFEYTIYSVVYDMDEIKVYLKEYDSLSVKSF